MNPCSGEAGSRHLVRPRWVWSGLALLLGGSALVALGMVLTSLSVILVGLAGLVVGGIVAVYGGIIHDSRSVRPSDRTSPMSVQGTRTPWSQCAYAARPPRAVRGRWTRLANASWWRRRTHRRPT